MIDPELIASILVPLMTKDGDPPEDELDYPKDVTDDDQDDLL